METKPNFDRLGRSSHLGAMTIMDNGNIPYDIAAGFLLYCAGQGRLSAEEAWHFTRCVESFRDTLRNDDN